jgi:hypothetical protein
MFDLFSNSVLENAIGPLRVSNRFKLPFGLIFMLNAQNIKI